MKLAFRRLGAYGSECEVRRDDGVRLHVRAAPTRHAPPHDLAHAVVESALGLSRGFWATVAAGAIFEGMILQAGRQRPHAREQSAALIRANGTFILQAEVLVSALMRVTKEGLDGRPDDTCKLVREAQSAVPIGAYPITAGELVQVVAALREAAASWRALPDAGAIEIDWHMAGRRGRERAPGQAADRRATAGVRLSL